MITNNNYRILNRDSIKIIAMFTMLLNHIATVFLDSESLLCHVFLSIGYFTAITMVYFLVEGYYYTHSKKTYLTRLFAFAIISEIPYCLAFTEAFGGKGIMEYSGLNIMFTLCLCFGLVWIAENIKKRTLKILLNIIMVILSFACDWSVLAPVITLLFIWSRNSEKKTKIAFCLATVMFGAFNLLGGLSIYPLFTNLLYAFLSMIGMSFAGFCIVFLYNNKRMEKGRTFSKWFFYLFYPTHLLIIGLIRVALLI